MSPYTRLAARNHYDIHWPDVFANNALINTRSDRELVADALMAWGNCFAGFGPIPESFGETLVKISRKINCGTDAKDFHKKADELLKP